jgi:hypothetical protein
MALTRPHSVEPKGRFLTLDYPVSCATASFMPTLSLDVSDLVASWV